MWKRRKFILQYAHNTESPVLSYNHEAELSAVVNLIYLAARSRFPLGWVYKSWAELLETFNWMEAVLRNSGKACII